MNVISKSAPTDPWFRLGFNRNSEFAREASSCLGGVPQSEPVWVFGGGGRQNKLFFFGTTQWLKIRQSRSTTGSFRQLTPKARRLLPGGDRNSDPG
jgi:hypothetical protein